MGRIEKYIFYGICEEMMRNNFRVNYIFKRDFL